MVGKPDLYTPSFIIVCTTIIIECEYGYTRQPPVTLNCNPYDATRLVLTCTAEGPSTPSFTIIWMRQKNGVDERLRGSQMGITINADDNIIINSEQNFQRRSSRLTVNGLSEVDDVGDYWCQVRLQNGTVLQKKSNILTLSSEAQYQGLGRCIESQFVDKEDCIHPPQVTVPGVTDALTPNTGPVVQTTASSSNLSLTPQSTDGAMEEPGSKNLAALYAVVAVIVVFCLVIVTLSIIIVVLYRKKCGPVRFKTEGKQVSTHLALQCTLSLYRVLWLALN